jgi:hypothetical protein
MAMASDASSTIGDAEIELLLRSSQVAAALAATAMSQASTPAASSSKDLSTQENSALSSADLTPIQAIVSGIAGGTGLTVLAGTVALHLLAASVRAGAALAATNMRHDRSRAARLPNDDEDAVAVKAREDRLRLYEVHCIYSQSWHPDSISAHSDDDLTHAVVVADYLLLDVHTVFPVLDVLLQREMQTPGRRERTLHGDWVDSDCLKHWTDRRGLTPTAATHQLARIKELEAALPGSYECRCIALHQLASIEDSAQFSHAIPLQEWRPMASIAARFGNLAFLRTAWQCVVWRKIRGVYNQTEEDFASNTWLMLVDSTMAVDQIHVLQWLASEGVRQGHVYQLVSSAAVHGNVKAAAWLRQQFANEADFFSEFVLRLFVHQLDQLEFVQWMYSITTEAAAVPLLGQLLQGVESTTPLTVARPTRIEQWAQRVLQREHGIAVAPNALGRYPAALPEPSV